MASSEPQSQPFRMFLWTIPRSVSTAFERCMSGLGNVALVHEPYTTAYYFGPDRKFFNTPFLPVEHDYSYAKVKAMMEAEFYGKDYVFGKDHAYSLNERYDMIPDGFIHSILIRDPARALASFYDVCNMPILRHYSLLNHVLPEGYAFKQLYDLYEHLRTTTGQEPVVLDSDDLLQYPEQMIRRYCEAIGVPFKTSMLDWDPQVNVTQSWASSLKLMQHIGVYEKALKSTTFNCCPPKQVDVLSLPTDYQHAIKVSQPFYDKLYERRLIPEDRETEV
ncbi:uncharacterized protein LOC110978324 [Acanthaster planci]|uniref:Uncharacterized protein LOC110978324 n=1 Tax=Acanthaster planci TaxID=133434 RepID=A0A8B7Y6T6_ACAPL|nr:uncharacterized protein LOC110978324 [Acanthaster planci]